MSQFRHGKRATGITVYLLKGGLLEYAHQMAAYESARTTKLYGPRNDTRTDGARLHGLLLTSRITRQLPRTSDGTRKVVAITVRVRPNRLRRDKKDKKDRIMYWDGVTFVAFIAMSLFGGATAYFILWIERKRRTVGANAAKGEPAPVLALSRTIGLIAMGLAVAAATSAAVSSLPSFFAPRTLGPGSNLLSQVAWTMVAAYVAMLAGMAASYLNKLIDQRRAKIAQLRANGSAAKPGLDFDVWDFVQPFLVSLITFGALVARTTAADTLTSILLGFETGFFWQSVLAGRVPDLGDSTNDASRSPTRSGRVLQRPKSE